MINQVVKIIEKIFIDFLPANKPDFIIIGAQKSGTSSLHYYLNQYPNLMGSIPKELHYFDIEINHGKTLKWYHNHFKSLSTGVKLYFESSPSYIYNENVAKNLSHLYPNIKLILILREPIKRAFSAWNMYRDIYEKGDLSPLKKEFSPGQENPIYKYLIKGRKNFPTFREAINIELDLMNKNISEEPAVLRRGLYYDQLCTYYKYFDKNQIMVLGFKELVSDLEGSLEKINNFLDIKKINFNRISTRIKNKRKYQSEINDEDYEFLNQFYAKPNEELFNLLGFKPNW